MGLCGSKNKSKPLAEVGRQDLHLALLLFTWLLSRARTVEAFRAFIREY